MKCDPPVGTPPPGTTSGLAALLTGAAWGSAAMGAVLTLADVGSPLRVPFTLFLLVGAPALSIGAALGRTSPLARAVVALAGALALDLLVAQAMLALHLWSVRGGTLAVAALSGAVLLLTALARARRAARARTGRAG
ncbi:hypothetical protein ACH4VT_06050 [Streptomyces lydicus]|uniref:hypothetical protein n=1 Tax=Streptomyces lydicus TaxID=47763 RepID=UPI0037A4AE17